MAAVDSVTIRRGTVDDVTACHDLLWESVTDLARRHGTPIDATAEQAWASAETLHRFLAGHAAEWWVAEERGSGKLLGYARSIARGGLLELTEFFVVPAHQSAGLGGALLERGFPEGRGEVRSIIATTDIRAQSRYVRAGTTARFPFFSLVGAPSDDGMAGSDLTARVLDAGSDRDCDLVRGLEHTVFEYPRGNAEVRWLLEERQGVLYRRDRAAVGFAFVGSRGVGPIAALEPGDLPAILLDVEARACAAGIAHLDFNVPSVNEVAMRHLLSRGFRLDPWINLMMSSRPFGQFDRCITFGPPLCL